MRLQTVFFEISSLACALALTPLAAQPPAQPAPSITGYEIDAELDPATHHLAAQVSVSFISPENAAEVSFSLYPGLTVAKIVDASGRALAHERTAEGAIRITPAAFLPPGQPVRWTFKYAGDIPGEGFSSFDRDSQGFKLAALQEPVSYLLYPSRWFPVSSGYLTNRFTAGMRIRVPRGMRVFASGSQGEPKPVLLANGQPGSQYSFNWTRPGFPGTVIAGRFAGPFTAGSGNVQVFLPVSHQQAADALAQAAAREYSFFTGSFGAAESSYLNVVEAPDGALPAIWAPELAAVPESWTGDPSGIRLLANIIARQWWGSAVSPRSLDDAWITNGMARYSELMYLENERGTAAMRAALQDVAAGALAYDTTPLSSASRLRSSSPEFQTMTMEKGAMIFHMLRGEMGDKDFLAMLQAVLRQYAGRTVSAAEFEKLAAANSRQPLTAFFAQWIDSAGAPRFTNKYAVYRLGNNKGFRTIGEIEQDLDLFRMPVELSIETDGKTETRKIEVVGANTHYVAETFGRPRRILIDPQGWVLKSTPDLQVRTAIFKGQQLVRQGDLAGAQAEYQKALEINTQSSLVNYRLGEVLFAQRNYQASVNAYRDALRGDGEPRWTEVWSHVQIGKIFDLTGQRDRAVNEYRLAVQTGDNGQGAVNEARLYLQKPYQPPEAKPAPAGVSDGLSH